MVAHKTLTCIEVGMTTWANSRIVSYISRKQISDNKISSINIGAATAIAYCYYILTSSTHSYSWHIRIGTPVVRQCTCGFVINRNAIESTTRSSRRKIYKNVIACIVFTSLCTICVAENHEDTIQWSIRAIAIIALWADNYTPHIIA